MDNASKKARIRWWIRQGPGDVARRGPGGGEKGGSGVEEDEDQVVEKAAHLG